jgi:trans-aconitate methyltransferase
VNFHADHVTPPRASRFPPVAVQLEGLVSVKRASWSVAGGAETLHELGFAEQHVRLQVYGHRLSSTDEVVEWTRGTTLVRFRRLLSPELFEAFVARYRQRLREVLGVRSPNFYAFKRILFWARRP